MRKYSFLLILLLFISLSSFGQAPLKITYQSIVRDSQGKLITNQSVGARFTILQHSITGFAVYTESQNITTNVNGLFTTQIGGLSFDTINWANGPYFLKIEIDPNNGTNYVISGTSQLLTVPYSLLATKSLTSDKAKKSDSTMFAQKAFSAGTADFTIYSQKADSATFAQKAIQTKLADTSAFARRTDSATFALKTTQAKLADTSAFARRTDSAAFALLADSARNSSIAGFAQKADTAKVSITHIIMTVIADTAKNVKKEALIYDKQIRFKITSGSNTSSSAYSIDNGEIIKFRKTDFIGVDSIIFVANPYTGGAGNYAEVELYNITDNVVVANSLLNQNTTSANALLLQTGNLFNSLPDKEIRLGLRYRSTVNGQFAGTGTLNWLFLYRR
jgi:hypothetical protein